MTRKDYTAIAKTIQESWSEERYGSDSHDQTTIDNAFGYLVNALLFTLASDNPRFDATRFVRAATPTDVPGREAYT